MKYPGSQSAVRRKADMIRNIRKDLSYPNSARSLAGGDDHHRSLQYRLQSRTRRLSAKADVDATVGVLAEHRF